MDRQAIDGKDSGIALCVYGHVNASSNSHCLLCGKPLPRQPQPPSSPAQLAYLDTLRALYAHTPKSRPS
ncbi:MAG: hypothetical protein HZC40_17995 [Chloroflexi bacterium]|nr:hypothetical protein [Chloroflexota bacterium]